MEPKYIKHVVFFGLFLLALVFGVILMWPFLKVMIVAIALAVLFYPIHRWFARKVTRGNTWLAALLTVIATVLIIGGPLFLIGTSITHQAQTIYESLAGGTKTTVLFEKLNGAVTRQFPWAHFRVEEKAAEIVNNLTNRVGDIVSFALNTIFSLFIIVLAMFYFLKDGPRWHDAIIHNSPLSNESTEKIIRKLSLAIDGVVKGYLLIASVQGVLLGIGLWIFGIPNPALWGLFAGIASLIPTVGTALVSIPAVIFLFSTGNTGAAIGLAIWASTLVGMIDNLLSPIVVGKRVDIHPMLILFSVLGGIALMGPAGILIGPLAISFIYALTSVYSDEMKAV